MFIGVKIIFCFRPCKRIFVVYIVFVMRPEHIITVRTLRSYYYCNVHIFVGKFFRFWALCNENLTQRKFPLYGYIHDSILRTCTYVRIVLRSYCFWADGQQSWWLVLVCSIEPHLHLLLPFVLPCKYRHHVVGDHCFHSWLSNLHLIFHRILLLLLFVSLVHDLSALKMIIITVLLLFLILSTIL